MCRESARRYDGNQWTIGAANSVTMEKLLNYGKVDRRDVDGDPTSGAEHCTCFDKELWFESVKTIMRKRRSIFQDHVKYMHNDIVKPFRKVILQYVEPVREIHNITKFLPPLLKKGDEYDQAD